MNTDTRVSFVERPEAPGDIRADPPPSPVPRAEPDPGEQHADGPDAPPVPPPLPPWVLVPIAAGICGLWATSVWVSVHVVPDPALHEVALFAHLAGLVLGFGAVLVIDWIGFLWLLGRRTFRDVTRTADAVHAVIWVSLLGLTASGALLAPDMSSPVTRLKLALVLIIGLNGLHAHALQPKLAAYDAGGRPPPALLVRSATTAGISQICWWAAMVIGFYNSRN